MSLSLEEVTTSRFHVYTCTCVWSSQRKQLSGGFYIRKYCLLDSDETSICHQEAFLLLLFLEGLTFQASLLCSWPCWRLPRLKVTSPSLVFCCACWNIGIPHLIMLRWIVLHFYKLDALKATRLSKSFGTIFPTAFARFVFLSHFGDSHNISDPSTSKKVISSSLKVCIC